MFDQVKRAYRALFEDWCGHEMSVRGAAAQCGVSEAYVRAVVAMSRAQNYDALVQVT